MTTLRALECLVAVVDHGSVTEAAAALHLSQPALSHQLAALERELGTPVVERLPRGVRPTVAGRAVVADARGALAAARRVVDGGRAVARGSNGRLRIACVESMTAGLLAPVLRTWRHSRPGVGIELSETTSADAAVEVLADGGADVAIGPRPTRGDHRVTTVGPEEVVLVLPAALAVNGVLDWERLAGLPVVGYHRDNGLCGWLEREAAAHGVVIEPVTRTRHAATATALAHAGLGVALVPTTALGPTTVGGLGAVRVAHLEPALSREVVAVVATPDDPMVRAFVADVVRRGVPVPTALARRLDAEPG